jgi:hypothetical protein
VVEYEYDSIGWVATKVVLDNWKMCMKNTKAESNLETDGRGRVWQRWVYLAGSEWDTNLTRYVYDGSAYAQEHNFTVAEDEGAWVYTYDQILTDYLRKPGGVRQRDISTVDQSETDQFLLSDSGSVSARIQRETNSLVQRVELTASGTAQAAGSQQDTTISKLGLRGGYTETFSGSTEFDPLVQMGGRHYLGGLGRFNNRYKNQPYLGGGEPMPATDPPGVLPGDFPGGLPNVRPFGPGIGWTASGTASSSSSSPSECPDCCWEDIVGDCYSKHGKSRECWHQMCCCPGLSVELFPPCYFEKLNGILPENFNCYDSCCKSSDYPDLGTGKSSSCGGSTKGMCWWSQPGLLQDAHGNPLAGKDLGDVLGMITTMCDRVHHSGCLDYCGNPLLCNCVSKFCDCQYSPTIHYMEIEDKGGYIDPAYPYRIHIDIGEKWWTLLHELIHYCNHHNGLLNLDPKSYACERACSSQSEWPTNTGYSSGQKDIDPCCCTAYMPARCYSLYDTAGATFWYDVSLITKIPEVEWGWLFR